MILWCTHWRHRPDFFTYLDAFQFSHPPHTPAQNSSNGESKFQSSDYRIRKWALRVRLIRQKHPMEIRVYTVDNHDDSSLMTTIIIIYSMRWSYLFVSTNKANKLPLKWIIKIIMGSSCTRIRTAIGGRNIATHTFMEIVKIGRRHNFTDKRAPHSLNHSWLRQQWVQVILSYRQSSRLFICISYSSRRDNQWIDNLREYCSDRVLGIHHRCSSSLNAIYKYSSMFNFNNENKFEVIKFCFRWVSLMQISFYCPSRNDKRIREETIRVLHFHLFNELKMF